MHGVRSRLRSTPTMRTSRRPTFHAWSVQGQVQYELRPGSGPRAIMNHEQVTRTPARALEMQQ